MSGTGEEGEVRLWILEQWAAGRRLLMGTSCLYAQVTAKEVNINDVASGPSWCYRFMKIDHLSIRTTTCTIHTGLPSQGQQFPRFHLKRRLLHTVALIYQTNIHQSSGRTLISAHTLIFTSLDMSVGYDQISHEL